MPSRRASSSTDPMWPEIKSSDHLRARATALSSGRSIRLGLESPSSNRVVVHPPFCLTACALRSKSSPAGENE